ncbi:hypothetical protein [Bradyrhizobium sp. I1.14.4]|uniref:hypothetical protein n=1 Tax=unclassified Bradyrhizobium TaxID=2631580 RepID=UPI003D1F16BE
MTDFIEAQPSQAEMRRNAGHQEILGETLAKFEFFMNGWHPYTRFLDVDKIDLILRRRTKSEVQYRELQVKFGKLHPITAQWERLLFSATSWRFFSERDLRSLTEREGLYFCYVLASDDGFKGDLFNFQIDDFARLVRQAPRVRNGKYAVRISRSVADPSRWYMRRKAKFDKLSNDTVMDVTGYYRNFKCLG